MTPSLPNNQLSQTALDWIGRVLGITPRRIHSARLPGSTSATLFKVAVEGYSQAWVLRLFDNAAWLAEEPDLVEHESAALEQAVKTGLPVPRLEAADPDGRFCGSPALLMTSLPGRVLLRPVDFQSWLQHIAEALPPLHAVRPAVFRWHYAPYNDPMKMTVPGWTQKPELWRRAIELAQEPWPEFEPCLIHRDYHPVNLLFEGQALSGIVDWPNACLGPAGVDVSWCRMNLTLLYGVPASENFLHACLAGEKEPCGFHPIWDLLAILEALPGPPEFYPPWQEFGMSTVPQQELIRRLEEHLDITLKRV